MSNVCGFPASNLKVNGILAAKKCVNVGASIEESQHNFIRPVGRVSNFDNSIKCVQRCSNLGQTTIKRTIFHHAWCQKRTLFDDISMAWKQIFVSQNLQKGHKLLRAVFGQAHTFWFKTFAKYFQFRAFFSSKRDPKHYWSDTLIKETRIWTHTQELGP